jgi:hypothetical protein
MLRPREIYLARILDFVQSMESCMDILERALSTPRALGISKLGAVVILVLGTAGCATHTWAPGVGMNGAKLESAEAQCSLAARQSGSAFSASGSAKFVVVAALVHGLGEAFLAQEDFNDCMTSGGWKVADQQVKSGQAPKEPQSNTNNNQGNDCVIRVWHPQNYLVWQSDQPAGWEAENSCSVQ